MTYNYQDNYEVIIHHDRTQFCRKNPPKTNFRIIIDDKDIDEGIYINFPYEHTYHSFKMATENISVNHKFERAGVIIYAKIDDVKYFCLGVDSKYGTLTDFGGGVKSNETFLQAASRELREESLNVFKFKAIELHKYSSIVYDKNMSIMFLRIKISDMNKFVIQFHKRLSKSNYSENSSIMWVNESIFNELVRTGKGIKDDNFIYPAIYKPVCDLLRSVSSMNQII